MFQRRKVILLHHPLILKLDFGLSDQVVVLVFPLDPEDPPARLDHDLDDSRLRLLQCGFCDLSFACYCYLFFGPWRLCVWRFGCIEGETVVPGVMSRGRHKDELTRVVVTDAMER